MLGRPFHFILDASLRGIAYRTRIRTIRASDWRSAAQYVTIVARYSFRVTGDDGSRFPGTAHHHDYRDDHHHDHPAEYTIRPVIRENITWPFKNCSNGEFTYSFTFFVKWSLVKVRVWSFASTRRSARLFVYDRWRDFQVINCSLKWKSVIFSER